MRVKNKFIFKYLVFFIFFSLIYFGNNLEVKAVREGGGSTVTTNALEKENAVNLQSSGEREIIDGITAYELGRFHYGQTEKMAKYISQYERVTGQTVESDQNAFLDYCVNTLNLQMSTELICYPVWILLFAFAKSRTKTLDLFFYEKYNPRTVS